MSIDLDTASYAVGFGSGLLAGFVLDKWVLPVALRVANALSRRRTRD